MTRDEIEALLLEQFPQLAKSKLVVVSVDEERAVMALAADEHHLRPGGTVSGPTLMMLADTAMYISVLAHVGPQTLAVTTQLNINFLRKPSAGRLLASCRMLKCGARLCVGEVELLTESPRTLVAHATVTYSVPPAA